VRVNTGVAKLGGGDVDPASPLALLTGALADCGMVVAGLLLRYLHAVSILYSVLPDWSDLTDAPTRSTA
jgi:hypothetical protein